jgi:curved DNA-binding protein CbpA
MTHYEVLAVPEDASEDTIKSAYRQLAKIHHPDRGGDADKFKSVAIAYATLSDPDRRQQYDDDLYLDEDPIDPAMWSGKRGGVAGFAAGLAGDLLRDPARVAGAVAEGVGIYGSLSERGLSLADVVSREDVAAAVLHGLSGADADEVTRAAASAFIDRLRTMVAPD